jgi:hypothetical protein
MKLYVCWGTFQTPRPGGHRCHNAYQALKLPLELKGHHTFPDGTIRTSTRSHERRRWLGSGRTRLTDAVDRG